MTEPLFTESDLAMKVSELGKKITEDYKDKQLLCVSILKGSFIFMADLIRGIDNADLTTEFMVVSSYGTGTTSSGNVKIILDLKVDIRGKHVLIVEDIIDTGLTIKHLMAVLGERKPASMEVCSLLLRKSTTAPSPIPKYVGFEITATDFVVGYGLDHDEKLRNLKYIVKKVDI
ncbi:MAG: hypoxanthine phosphoribosyltransferase [Harvfovirus sp.]|uniref:hypoxanthine phosphoribosyltransferase n=1 Tax=Harvfovirus sp. TaxID=2487768 RepID=A0A3G5A4V1_9VIRU|nr:MAG: hypoxanthine phosphoribosyltransferase [Harvfovirus sp.]